LRKAAAITILPAGLARGFTANEKLNLGVIGLTERGRGCQDFRWPGRDITALCDVDRTILDERGVEYESRKDTDFRKMIEKDKLDGVVVAVPNHNHAYVSVYAMKQWPQCLLPEAPVQVRARGVSDGACGGGNDSAAGVPG
jgi:hypothetical protein